MARLYDDREPQAPDILAATAHHAKVWRRHPGIADELLGDHFVERQGVTERARPGVGDAGHLQHGGDMRVARLALNSICHVEDHPGGAALRIGRHEALERGEHFLVALAEQRIVAKFPQRRDDVLDSPRPISLRARLAEPIEDAGMIVVPHNYYPHKRSLQN